MEQNPNKRSPLTQRSKKRVNFDEEKSRFRAVTEEVDGAEVRKLRGYPILFDVPGRPYRGSMWVEKIDKNALADVDLSNIVILIDHNTTWALGRSGKNMNATVDDTGLFVDVTLGNTWIDDYIYDRVQREIIDSMSFWFDSQAVIASDWDNKIDYVMKINEIYEVSIVVFPAYDETVIIAADGEAEDPEPETPEEDEALKAALQNLIEQL
ncbi:HK97 family phage prohead protease [Cohnella sp.]|uniref:HK97 family phage prohead protease n=1 Tax=Cohnella sp. TaxID=1883426 RepID=UPI003561F265